MAEISLHVSIDEIKAVEVNATNELQKLVQQVRQLDPKKQRASLHDVLRRSRVLRNTLEKTRKKRIGVEQHLETLKQSQLNQSMMTSMKQTSDALQTLGLKVEDADSIMVDLEENTHDLNAMQSTLAQNFTESDISADELESELELMLSEDALWPMPTTHGPRQAKRVVGKPTESLVENYTTTSKKQDNDAPPPDAAPLIEATALHNSLQTDIQHERVAENSMA